MDNSFAVNPFYGYDWTSIMNNPYYQVAWNTPNPNFKGRDAVQPSLETTEIPAGYNNEAGAIPVVATPAESEGNSDSTLGTVTKIGGTILAAGGIYWAFRKGHLSNIGKYVKNLFGKSENAVSEGALKRLRAIKCSDGKIRFNVPEKTTTKYGKQITELVNNYGIQGSVSAERIAYNPTSSVLEGFRVTAGKDKYVVYTKDGNITKIVDELGENILKRLTEAESKSADAAILEKCQNVIKELGKDKDIDKALLRDVQDIRFTNTFGDDVLKMTSSKYDADPKLREFTTLERFNFTDNEVQTLKLGADEAAFANSKFYRDGKLVDGIKVEKFSQKIGSSNVIGNFENQTLVSITKPDGTVLEEGSAGFKAFADEYQKDIDKIIRKVFIKREVIPEGAILTAA